MEIVFFEKPSHIKKNLPELEQRLKVKIIISGRKVTIDGEPMDEYAALPILDAVAFGFPAREALLLLNPEIIYKKVNIKSFTRRKNLEDVKARVIGKFGTTKRTIEEVADCKIIISDNSVGLIGYAERIDEAITALSNLIRGSKQANVYSYLERMNRERKKKDDDLGLKIKEKKE